MLYVLDEPSIGLHPRDNDRLLDTLTRLRDLGNTVLVVEHDAETIERADYVIDLGPGAGRLGGELVAQGTPRRSRTIRIRSPASISRGCRRSARPRCAARQRQELVMHGAREHNLKNIDVEFPLGLFIVVTGVSGSGKSTLVNDILYRVAGAGDLRLARRTGAARFHRRPRADRQSHRDRSVAHRPHAAVESRDLHRIFTPIRDLYAMLPESRERGYKPGRFSFNVKGGRCEACQGDGLKRIEMNFLPDVYVTCDVCRGRRYNHETLQVKYKGYSIADLLGATVEEALDVLENIPQIQAKLETLVDVGLGISTSANPRPRFRAAKRSASSWRTN